MPTAAREVAGHLLEFGLTDSDLNDLVAAQLIAVGMAGRALELQGRIADPEALDRMTRQAADQAVLHPEWPSGSPPEILEAGKRIRRVLERVDEGDEPGAFEILRDVSRTSPFADWRWFAKGLAAFRRGDDSELQTRPSRIQPGKRVWAGFSTDFRR